MQVVQQLDEQQWKAFVDNTRYGSIFHTPEMFRVFAQTKGNQPALWAVVDNSGHPLALMPLVYVTLMDGLLRQLTTRAIAYGSVLCAPGLEGKQALRLLLETYKREAKNRALFSELRNLYDLSDIQDILAEHSFAFEGHLNYLINLNRPAEEVLQSIGQRTRKKIRKGLRDGLVKMSEVTNTDELEHWYEILQKTYSNAQVPLADRSLFVAAFKELYPKGMAKFLLAKVDRVTAACSIELPYKDTIYGWYGGSDREYSDYLPNEMLIWHILEWGANNGYHTYDFGGAGKPDEEYGVRDFKAKFGGDLVNFGRNIYVHNSMLLRLSKQGYEVYRRFLMK
jgi:lipid II:glycine glycyltransferase (peptidoglycan interpeptide bridge formation enzyme)